MLAILKLIQSLVSTLHSEGTPAQIGLGVAFGAALGLTPIANAHNAVAVVLLLVLNVSFGAGLLAWVLFTPVGFLLDPLFDRIGHALLLGTPSLTPLWTTMYNMPAIPFTNFNNTVVLGSVVVWLVLFGPIAWGTAMLVVRYRATLGARLEQTKFLRAMKATKAYDVYRWFVP